MNWTRHFLTAVSIVVALSVSVQPASHKESEKEKINITKEQQEALDSLIESLEVLRSNPESLKLVEAWFESELGKNQEELSQLNRDIEELETKLKKAAAQKEELEKKLQTLQTGQKLISRLSGKSVPLIPLQPAKPPDEPKTEEKQSAQTPDAAAIYTKHVQEILAFNCIACHSGDDPGGGLEMSSRTSILKGGGRGAALVPGSPKDSLLYQLIQQLKEPYMPLGADKLSNEDIEKIAAWIKAEKE